MALKATGPIRPLGRKQRMVQKLSRRTALKIGASGLAAAAIGAPAVLRAQSAYPDRPIVVVVPFDTGGYNDRLARAFVPFLQEALGQPLPIVNRGGAGALQTGRAHVETPGTHAQH